MRFVKQSHKFSCGPACACMMLAELGFITNENELIELLECASGKGTPMPNWVKLKEKFPVEVLSKQPGTIEELEKMQVEGWLLILLITSEVPHYVCFDKVEQEKIFFHDPWDGPSLSLPIKDFHKIWQVDNTWSKYFSTQWFVGIKKIVH